MAATATVLTATLLSLSLAAVCLFGYLAIAFLAFDQPVTSPSAAPNGPLVISSSGKIQGVFRQTLGQRISAFYGVPFARPPIGFLRFARPEPVDKWRGVFKATSMPPACMQFHSDILPWDANAKVPESEDCLKLNIWTPDTDGNKSRPVLIWIHGGGFVSGHMMMPEFDGSVLSAFADSVVAMMNYRVGVFGFLNLGDGDISGNMGLFDQVLAIQWIKRNARSFGGDPNAVTLFGQSAGAASIGFHMISPLSKDLFRRAILQSGSPLMPISLVTDQQMEATAADVLASCACDRSHEPAACLRSTSVSRLLHAQERVIRRKDDTTFSPSFYDDFLPKHPFDAMREGDFGQDKQVLLGFTRDEGSIFMYFANPQKYPAVGPHSQPNFNVSLSEVHEFAAKFMKNQNPLATRNLLNSLYADVKNESIFNATRTHVGEFLVTCPMIFAADDYSRNNFSVFFYQFVHQPKNSAWSKWVGSAHYDEVQFMFGLPLAQPRFYSRDEVKLSKRMIQAWTSFARTGKPTISTHTQWPKYTSQQEYVELSARSARIKRPIPQAKCNLWRLTFEIAHSQSDADHNSSIADSTSDTASEEDSEPTYDSGVENEESLDDS